MKNNLKKTLKYCVSLFMVICLTISLVGCGSNKNVAESNDLTDTSKEIYHRPVSEEQVKKDKKTKEDFIANELLLFTDLDKKEEVEQYLKENDLKIVGKIQEIGYYQVELKNKCNSIEELDQLSNKIKENSNGLVTSCHQNLIVEDEVNFVPNDKEFEDDWNDTDQPGGKNWWLEAIHAPQAWDLLNKGKQKTVKVGIIDTFLKSGHPDINFKQLDGYENKNKYKYSNDDSSPYHGAHVAGIIAANSNNNEGICGTAPSNLVELYGFDVNKTTINSLSNFNAKFAVLLSTDCKVINISLATPVSNGERAQNNDREALEEFNTMWNDLSTVMRRYLTLGKDFVICNSAGNFNYGNRQQDRVGLNAKYSYFNGIEDADLGSRIIVVGAAKHLSNNQYEVSDFSSPGDRVDVVAPGEAIYSCFYEKEGLDNLKFTYDYLDGTSQATPIVSGIASMLYSANPKLTGPEVKKIIVDTATKKCKYSSDMRRNHQDLERYTYGLVDAEAAVRSASPKNLYAKYYEIIQAKQRELGVAELVDFEDDNPYSEPGSIKQIVGLSLVKLIDMDQDGKEEMILVYPTDQENAHSYYKGTYMFELYTDNGENMYGPYPITHEIHTLEINLSIIKSKVSGNPVIKASYLGQESNVTTYYELVNNELDITQFNTTGHPTAGNEKSYLNGNPISTDEQEQYLKDKGYTIDYMKDEIEKIQFIYFNHKENSELDQANQCIKDTEETIEYIKSKQ